MLQEFGLGVVIQATDKASSVFGNVQNAFGQMQSTIAEGSQSISKDMLNMQEIMASSVVGHTLKSMGEGVISKGKGMMSWITDFAKEIIQVGDSVDKTMITLEALYKSAEAGAQKYQDIVKYALKTPFEIEQLTGIVTMFKAIGIEALGLESVVTSTSGRSEELLSVMSDLASLQPQIPFNMSAYAVKEYIAEGNTISLLRRMSLDIGNILGRDLGKTIEQRKVDIADLVEALGAEGLTDKLFGTWSQIMSNFSDFFFNMKSAIGDAGMFDALKASLNYVGELAQGLDPELVKKFAQSMSDGFMFIFKPIDKVVRRTADFIKMIMEYIGDNPWVMKLAFGFTAIASAVTIASGAILVLGGSFLILTAGIRMIPYLTKQIGGMGLAFKGALFFLAKFAVLAGLAFYAWKTNFLGIKDFAKGFGQGMKDIFTGVSVGLDTNGRAFVLWTEKLLKSDSAYERFAGNMLKIVAVVRGLIDVWNDDTLSPENYTALNDLGLLPIIENALIAKKNVEDFLEGMERGFKKFNDTIIDPYIIPAIKQIKEFGKYLKDEFLPLLGFGDELSEGEQAVKDSTPSGFKKLGEDIAFFAGFIGVLFVVLKLAKLIKGVFGGVGTAIGGIAKLVVAHPLLAFLVIAGVLVYYLYNKFDEVKDAVDALIGIVGILALVVATVVGVFIAGIAFIIISIVSMGLIIYGIFASIVDTWITTWKIIKEFWEGWKESFWLIVKALFTGDWSTVLEDLKGIWGEKWENVMELFDGWKERFQTRWDSIGTYLSGVWTRFRTPVDDFFGFVAEKFSWFLEKLGIVDTELSKRDAQIDALANSAKSSNTGQGGGFVKPVAQKNTVVNRGNQNIDSGYQKTTKKSNTAFDIGSRFIPYDMHAKVHRGEMIVPEKENPYVNSNGKILPFTPKSPRDEGDNYDMSVTFSEGAIVLNVQNATPEEAERLATEIMKKIDRKRDLEKIRTYKRGVS